MTCIGSGAGGKISEAGIMVVGLVPSPVIVQQAPPPAVLQAGALAGLNPNSEVGAA